MVLHISIIYGWLSLVKGVIDSLTLDKFNSTYFNNVAC
jgi:hypothetical protein